MSDPRAPKAEAATISDIICETPRLILRKIVDSDVDSLLSILGNAEVMRFSVNGPDNRDGVLKFIEATKKRYARDGVAQWAVILKSSGVLIGECGISVQMIDGVKEFEIGYRFNPQFWRQGFASEAAITCREYGFEKLEIKRLISIIEKENEASIRVATKVGMHLEKESVFHGIPVEIYSLERGSIEFGIPKISQTLGTFEIRPATEDDAAGIRKAIRSSIEGFAAKDYPAEVVQSWGADTPQALEKQKAAIRGGRELTWVALQDGKIVGFSAFSPQTEELRAVYVAAEVARHGVGTKLLECVEHKARELDVKSLKMHSSLTAEPFYKRHGYSALNQIIHTLSTGVKMAAVEMRKDLAGTSPYTFAPMTKNDLPLLFRWVQESHVKQWWGTEDIWDDFQARYMANTESEDCFPHIVSFEGHAIGYINYWTTESDPDFRDLFPSGAVGTDQFIGIPGMIGKGHGHKFVKAFTDWLLNKPHIPVVMTDPDIKNTAAIKSYQKAGFKIVKEMKSAEGTILLMEKRK